MAVGCPICERESDGAEVSLGEYRAHRCRSCGFRWIDHDDLDRAQEAASFQDYPHNAFLRRHFEAMKPLYRRGLLERVERALPGKALGECSFLDVGCANGEYLWAARSIGFGEVKGVEVDSVAAANAQAFGEVTDDAGALPTASFDVVQLKNVVANLRDFRSMLATCAALARPGGAVFVDAPNEDSLAARVKRWRRGDGSSYGYLRPPHIINGFGRESLTRLVKQCGLLTVSVQAIWIGHPLAPYRATGGDPMGVLGRVLPGTGALLVADCRRPEVSKSSRAEQVPNCDTQR